MLCVNIKKNCKANIKKRIVSYTRFENLPTRLKRMVAEVNEMEFIKREYELFRFLTSVEGEIPVEAMNKIQAIMVGSLANGAYLLQSNTNIVKFIKK